MTRAPTPLAHLRGRALAGLRRAKLSVWQKAARLYVRAAILEASQYLRKNGPITVLIDSSALGHGITHESVWIDTGTVMWGGTIPVQTGYEARVPVHAPGADERLPREVTYLVGVAELARQGLIKLVTSAELQAEALRQPLGRFRGYDHFDLNIFEGIPMPSVDGYHLDLRDPKARQQERVKTSRAEPFKTLAALLPAKMNLDAWHVHTAHQQEAFCFLAIDFPLSEAMRQAQRKPEFPELKTRVMLPSELAQAIGLRPIPTYLISYERSSWAVHHDRHLPGQQRQSRRRKNKSVTTPDKSNEAPPPAHIDGRRSPINRLPAVAEMMGGMVSSGEDGVAIQYKDKNGQIQELAMPLGDALYLLSILKAIQLNLDIPFPDDPRDPNAKPIRPSDRPSEVNA